MSNVLRNVPTVAELLESPPLRSLVQRVSQNVVVTRVRQFVDDMRTQVQSAAANVPVPASVGELAQRIADWIASEERPALVPVINATGVIIPEQWGRAPLAEEAIAAVAAIARGYAAVDLDPAGAGTLSRPASIEKSISGLTGAEASAVVNNHAAATLISLAALAAGREVVVSRGQLVADGDAYRLPDLLAASGAYLRAVGTTNCTRIDDHAGAIGPQTAAILHVHVASFALSGAHEQPSLASLVTLARRHGLPLISDLGSGAVHDLARYGLLNVPLVGDAIRAGVDLVVFSGDRWLGGPQCGIALGRRSLVDKIVQHSLFSALRADKLTLAALAATLKLHADPDLAERSLPVLSLLATPLENLQNRAERLAPQIAAAGIADVQIVSAQTYVTGVPLPDHALSTVCLALTPRAGTVHALAVALRSGNPPILGRLEGDKLLLDLRSVPPRDDAPLVTAMEARRTAVSAEQAAEPAIGPQ
jgi:L-seryl-tRNA(Ser) seleniumtransferase